MTVLDQYCCSECGVLYGLERNYANRRSQQNKSWYCPNGHNQVFRESALTRAEKAAQRAQELLDQERRCHESTRERLSSVARNLEHTEKRRAAQAGVTTRMKNRIKNGVCPCCKRTFRQLAEHMKTMHPEYVTSEVEQA